MRFTDGGGNGIFSPAEAGPGIMRLVATTRVATIPPPATFPHNGSLMIP